MDSCDDGHLSPDRLDAVLKGVCEAANLDPSGATLLKFTNSAVFDLPSEAVVVKIAGSDVIGRRVPNVIRVVRWLADHEFPAVRLVETISQPVIVEGHTATVWHRVPPVGREPTGGHLASLLLRLHALPCPEGLPAWEPMSEIRGRLAEAEELDGDDRAFLEDRCDSLGSDLTRLRFELPRGVIHGDAFLGNLIPGPDGPVMCDFDGTSVGPREWDLTPVAVGKLRFDYPDDAHSALAAGYDFDVTRWEGFPVLRQIRELKLVTSVLPILRSNPGIRRQFRHRLASFKAGDPTRWEPYASAAAPGPSRFT